MDPDEFEQAFPSWIKDISELTDGDAVSIDGKTVCGSRDGDSRRAIHTVSAWSKASQLSLGQVKVNEKSNEITAIPKLLDVLVLKGCLVTMDATGCQRDIAARITEKGADYLLAVKGSRGCLEEDAERTVRFTKPTSEWMEEDSGHGRIEQRKCTLYTDLSFIDRAEAWKNPSATVKIEAARYIKSSGKEEKEVRLYITSSKANAEAIGKGVRSHWGIENNLH
ncbi:Transposase [Bacteroidales bacterium Barb6XT]|nr:Transposase [Bacteroidales bacterium Barb6XT]